MDRDIQDIVGEIGFNYDADAKEFGIGKKVITLTSSVSEQGEPLTTIGFMLGRKEDDDVSITMRTHELMKALIETLAFGESYLKE